MFNFYLSDSIFFFYLREFKLGKKKSCWTNSVVPNVKLIFKMLTQILYFIKGGGGREISADNVVIFNSKFYEVDPGDHSGVLHV